LLLAPQTEHGVRHAIPDQPFDERNRADDTFKEAPDARVRIEKTPEDKRRAGHDVAEAQGSGEIGLRVQVRSDSRSILGEARPRTQIECSVLPCRAVQTVRDPNNNPGIDPPLTLARFAATMRRIAAQLASGKGCRASRRRNSDGPGTRGTSGDCRSGK
jgi:hypothetical protein